MRQEGMKSRTSSFNEELRLLSKAKTNNKRNGTDLLPCECAFGKDDIALEKKWESSRNRTHSRPE